MPRRLAAARRLNVPAAISFFTASISRWKPNRRVTDRRPILRSRRAATCGTHPVQTHSSLLTARSRSWAVGFVYRAVVLSEL